MTAGCERLVHPSVVDGSERARHRRLLGVLLASPFFAAFAVSQAYFAATSPALTLAAIFTAFAVFWSAALVTASTGRVRLAGIAVLYGSILPVGALFAGAGGGASPFAMMLTAFAFEAGWIWRTRRAIASGVVAAVAALLAGSLLPGVELGAVSGWHWLVPIAYAATVGVRIAALFGERANRSDADSVTLEDIMDAVVFRITGGGEVLDASAKARDMLRLAPELLLGNGLFERVHVADRVAYLCAVSDMRGSAANRHVEVRLRLPGETEFAATDNYRTFTIELANPCDGTGEIIAIARMSAAAGLREALASASEMASSVEIAKGRFLATVSHELRTPLNAIIGFADMLGHEICGPLPDPRQKEYVGLIKESGHHLLAVVNSILDISKMESGAYAIRPEPFRFREPVAMCHSMLAFQAGAKAIHFKTDISHNVGEITGDRLAVQQMLINLVSNAIKFTPAGGEVTIGAKRFGSRLHFWVSDNGIGIDADDLARLGEPFVQVQNDYTRQYEGTGLGLSLVKGLVALHDGTMTVESAPNEGTTVTISLPVAGPALKDAGQQRDDISDDKSGSNEGTDGSLRKTA